MPKESVGARGYFTPYVVNASLWIELQLKCLLLLDGGSYPTDHRLDRLYDLLNPAMRARVDNYTNILVATNHATPELRKNFPTLDLSAAAKLKRSGKAFVKFRYYPTETFEDAEGFEAHEVGLALRKVALEEHPEWEHIAPPP